MKIYSPINLELAHRHQKNIISDSSFQFKEEYLNSKAILTWNLMVHKNGPLISPTFSPVCMVTFQKCLFLNLASFLKLLYFSCF